jgi:drug/metabolite transporter (DMT)-like permease
MHRSSTFRGLAIAVAAALAFGMSGPFVKPLLEAGWSPAAAVTTRALVGGLVLAPMGVIALRGRWRQLWRSRNHILIIGLIGVAATQLAYFAAIQTIPVGTGILIEFMAPLLLVAFVWARSRKAPGAVVIFGSVFALIGLFLVVSPSGGAQLDVLGLSWAAAAAVGCAVYFVFAAKVDPELPTIAIASVSLLLGGAILGLVGLTGAMPLTATFGTVNLFDGTAPWWVPMLIVAVVATGVSYSFSIKASQLLGARLASFAGLLAVVAAPVYAGLPLGAQLGLPQLIGGGLILVGIALVRSEKTADAVTPTTGPITLERAA